MAPDMPNRYGSGRVCQHLRLLLLICCVYYALAILYKGAVRGVVRESKRVRACFE